MKLVHLVGFITRKFVTMHGHMNVKKNSDMFVYESSLNLAATVSDCATLNQRAIVGVFMVRRR